MSDSIKLTQIGRFDTGIFDESAAEIPTYDPISQRLFVVNGENATVDVLDLSDPTNPTLLFSIESTRFNGSPNSVDINNGLVAVAIENNNPQEPGQVVFFDTDGKFLNSVTVGALPDNLTFTPDGQKILVANEAEPNEDNPEIDPQGSVSIIDISGGVGNPTVITVDFTAFNGQEAELRSQGVRIFPDKTFAQDAEPEHIAVSADGKTAFVTLQENNTVAVIDIKTGQVKELQPLGVQDYSQGSVQIDVSDKDGKINLQNQPVFGLFQPDTIATYQINGETYYVTANEGDARNEDVRIEDLVLDPIAFPNAEELQKPENLGRLEASSIDGDLDGDGDIDKLFIYGGRSFSIRDSKGNLVFDSGDQFARIVAKQIPELFNSEGTVDTLENRSDNKGVEPEGLAIGEIDGHVYAFIGLERVSGVMVYDITNPTDAQFVQYINPIDKTTGNAINLSPEGLKFISAKDSPNGQPLLAVANAVSGTTTIYQVNVPGLLIKGTKNDDVLKGGTGNDTIKGGKGDDIIIAGAGNDKLKGGRGDDLIEGSIGNDLIKGGKGDDILKGGAGNDLIKGGRGDDILKGGTGNDTMRGGKGDDTIMAGAGNDLIKGGKGDDILIGGEGNDLIKAGKGNNLLFGLEDSDTLVGGKGNDIFQIDLESGGGSQIRDVGGDEKLLITTDLPLEVLVGIEENKIDQLNQSNLADIQLSAPEQGVIGIGKDGSNLIIDLNQDGILEVANDLTISDFFNRSGRGEGKGFIEEINNLKGEDILEFFTESCQR